jgi:hypothetical protein
MRVLPVDVDQQRPEFAQLRHVGRHAADVAARPAIRIDHAAHQDQVTVGFEILAREPVQHRASGQQRKLRRQLGAFAPGADDRCVGTCAQQQPERVDENRLASASFARQRTETRREVEFQPVNENEVTYEKTFKHEAGIKLPWVLRSSAASRAASQSSCIRADASVSRGKAIARCGDRRRPAG